MIYREFRFVECAGRRTPCAAEKPLNVYFAEDDHEQGEAKQTNGCYSKNHANHENCLFHIRAHLLTSVWYAGCRRKSH